jgi:hypothetical protein
MPIHWLPACCSFSASRVAASASTVCNFRVLRIGEAPKSRAFDNLGLQWFLRSTIETGLHDN